MKQADLAVFRDSLAMALRSRRSGAASLCYSTSSRSQAWGMALLMPSAISSN